MWFAIIVFWGLVLVCKGGRLNCRTGHYVFISPACQLHFGIMILSIAAAIYYALNIFHTPYLMSFQFSMRRCFQGLILRDYQK